MIAEEQDIQWLPKLWMSMCGLDAPVFSLRHSPFFVVFLHKRNSAGWQKSAILSYVHSDFQNETSTYIRYLEYTF